MTDGSPSILREFGDRLSEWSSAPDQARPRHQPGIPRHRRRNHGFARLQGHAAPGALDFVAGISIKSPFRWFMAIGSSSTRRSLELGRRILPKHDDEILRWIDYVPEEILFWRRSLWEAVGGLDESCSSPWIWNLLLRFQKAGAQFAHVPEFLGAFGSFAGRVLDTYQFDWSGRNCRDAACESGYVPSEKEVSQRVSGISTSSR